MVFGGLIPFVRDCLIIFFDGPFTLDGKSCSLVLRGNNFSVFLLFEIENQNTPLQKLLQWGQG